MTDPTVNARACEAHWDEAISLVRQAADLLEKAKRLAFPPQVPSTVDGHKIGSRSR
jgi:hypothetical protein